VRRKERTRISQIPLNRLSQKIQEVLGSVEGESGAGRMRFGCKPVQQGY